MGNGCGRRKAWRRKSEREHAIQPGSGASRRVRVRAHAHLALVGAGEAEDVEHGERDECLRAGEVVELLGAEEKRDGEDGPLDGKVDGGGRAHHRASAA